MKRKDLDTIKSLSVEELQKKIVESERYLAQVVRERYTKQSKNTRESRTVRKNIAQMKTIQRQKELVA